MEEAHEGDVANRYAYTVGLSLFEAPELIVFGLPTEAAVPLLTAAAYEGIDMAEDAGSDTVEVSGLLERFPIGIQMLSAPERYLIVAHTLWNEWAPAGEKAPFRAVRLLLVDEDGVPDMGHALAAVDGSILPPPPAVGSRAAKTDLRFLGPPVGCGTEDDGSTPARSRNQVSLWSRVGEV